MTKHIPKQFSLLRPYSQIYVPTKFDIFMYKRNQCNILIQILVQFNHFLSFILLQEGTLVGHNVVGHLDHSQNLYVCLFV